MVRTEREGYIVYICKRCGFIFEVQGWGDNRLTSKYRGVTDPAQLARYYTRCPRCGAPLNRKPAIEIYPLKKINIEKIIAEYKGEAENED